MKRKLLVVLSLFLVLCMLVSPISVFAEELEGEHEITGDSTASVEVSVTVLGDFVVKIPKKIILDGETKSGTYRVGVMGSLLNGDFLQVIPDSSMTLTQSSREPVSASISQDKTEWSNTELEAEALTYTDGSITASNLSAGQWSGNANFKIKLNKSVGVAVNVSVVDSGGVSVAATASVIGGQSKTDLSQALVDAGYVVDTSLVKGLFSIQTDEFIGTATATLDVSSVAEPGDIIGIYHYDEGVGEWEFIGTAIVSDEGTVTGQFSSFSPVAITVREPGLYGGDGKLLCKWGDSGINVEIDYTPSDYKTKTTSAYYVTKNIYSDCTEIVLPQDIAKIGEYAFSVCSSLINVTIPEGANEIGQCAFTGCSNLKSVSVPESVTKIGPLVFSNCSNLISVTYKGQEYSNPSSLKTVLKANGVKVDSDFWTN